MEEGGDVPGVPVEEPPPASGSNSSGAIKHHPCLNKFSAQISSVACEACSYASGVFIAEEQH